MLSQEDLLYLQRYRGGRSARRRPQSARILKPPRSVVPPVQQVNSVDTLIDNFAASTTGVGAFAGGALATALTGLPIAAPIGSAIGTALETALVPMMAKKAKSIFGSGDYVLKSNSLVQTGGATESDVQIVPQGNRAVRIIYREYLGDVFTHATTAGAFNLVGYSINPGLVGTFPWFAPIAQQYEQWTPNGVVFEFKSTSSEYVATQALGSVIMATEYDSLDRVFANKQEMLNSAYSNEAKPSERIIHGVECDPRDMQHSVYYVRSGAVPSTGNIRDYDVGTFYIATQGGATANLNLGSLYVHYDITLRKEQLFNGIPTRGQLTFYQTRTGAIAASAPIGDTIGTQYGNMGNIVGVNRLELPSYGVGATWMIFVEWHGGTGAVWAPPAVTLTGCTAVSSTENAPLPGDTGRNCSTLFHVSQTAPVCYVAFGLAGTIPTTNCYCTIIVRQTNVDWTT